LVDKDVDHSETAARLRDDLVDRFIAGEIGLNRHDVCVLLSLLSGLGEFGETLGGGVDRPYREPFPKQTQHEFAADAAGSRGHNRRPLLFAHPPLALDHDDAARSRSAKRLHLAVTAMVIGMPFVVVFQWPNSSAPISASEPARSRQAPSYRGLWLDRQRHRGGRELSNCDSSS
jgi:hypothetical protein